MSYHRSSLHSEPTQSRDPRQRDRSRSEIRRTDASTAAWPSMLPVNPPSGQEQPSPTSGVLDFLKTLGLSSQLVQALVNANPPKIEPVQQQSSVNNAQEFASFLSQSYGLDSPAIPITAPSVNRDPRRRQIPQRTPIPTISAASHSEISSDALQRLNRPADPRTTNNAVTNPMSSMSIEESYRQYLSRIDSSLFDDETRQRFQRIALLDSELDKLHRMNVELAKHSERRSRRRTWTKDKDPLLKESELLQNELIDYIKTLKTAMMINCPTYMLSHGTIFDRH